MRFSYFTLWSTLIVYQGYTDIPRKSPEAMMPMSISWWQPSLARCYRRKWFSWCRAGWLRNSPSDCQKHEIEGDIYSINCCYRQLKYILESTPFNFQVNQWRTRREIMVWTPHSKWNLDSHKCIHARLRYGGRQNDWYRSAERRDDSRRSLSLHGPYSLWVRV